MGSDSEPIMATEGTSGNLIVFREILPEGVSGWVDLWTEIPYSPIIPFYR